jgi:hypothetical protein
MYHIDAQDVQICDTAGAAFSQIFRTDFNAPGFALINCGPQFGSEKLRRAMLELKRLFSEMLEIELGTSLRFLSMGRFDQQVTTKFHLDGAPDQSVLILGYEASRIRSRLSMADYTRCAYEMGIEPKQFLDDHNPMFAPGAQLLESYIVELTKFQSGDYQILIVNNSSQAFSTEKQNLLGVMHKAEILTPNAAERRIVNSTMLYVANRDEAEKFTPAAQELFATTKEISGPVKPY